MYVGIAYPPIWFYEIKSRIGRTLDARTILKIKKKTDMDKFRHNKVNSYTLAHNIYRKKKSEMQRVQKLLRKIQHKKLY